MGNKYQLEVGKTNQGVNKINDIADGQGSRMQSILPRNIETPRTHVQHALPSSEINVSTSVAPRFGGNTSQSTIPNFHHTRNKQEMQRNHTDEINSPEGYMEIIRDPNGVSYLDYLGIRL